MPTFSVSLTGPAMTIAVWNDPPSASPPAPSRLNPNPLSPPRYRRVQVPGGGGSTTLTAAAVVNGVVGPSDAALGGAPPYFVWIFAEASGPAPPMIIPVPGFSSQALITLVGPVSAGHYLLSCRRLGGGGAINVPFDVEA